MQLQVPEVNRKAISHDFVSKMLVAEHSDLNNIGFGRLYDDACDIGVQMQMRDGTVSRWYFSEDKRDADGDLIVSILKPCSESILRHPEIAGYTFHILND